MSSRFSQSLAHITGGRRYCFFITTYHDKYTLYERIRGIVAEATGFECIRADDIPGAGEDLRTKIHSAIEDAALVIADISDLRPNVYYEVGYAAARGKALLLIAEEGCEIPTDLLGVEMLYYSDSRGGMTLFDQSLREHLKLHEDSHVSLLRVAIVPDRPNPSYILLNPRQTVRESRFHLHGYEQRTYGDYLGVTGVLSAFASIYNESAVPEILSAALAPDDLDQIDANLYTIGSFKVNKFTSKLLDKMQRGRHPNWRFSRCPGEEGVEDFEVQLSGSLRRTPLVYLSESVQEGPFETECGLHTRDRWPTFEEDYGLFVRGPHPQHPGRMVAIMAGPHSLGTSAACLVATRSELIRHVAQLLAGKVELTSRDQTIWVLAGGRAGEGKDSHDVRIVAAGVYEEDGDPCL